MPNFDIYKYGDVKGEAGKLISFTTTAMSWIKVDNGYHFADTRQTCCLVGRMSNYRAD